MLRLVLCLAAALVACGQAKPVMVKPLLVQKENPVTMVVKKLEAMQKQLEADAEKDQLTFDTFHCFVKNTVAEKTAAIEEGNRLIAEAQATMERTAGSVGSLGAEIKGLQEDVAEAEAGLAKAASMRKKETATFNEHEKDLLVSINSLGNAIKVLSKHQSLLEVPQNTLVAIAGTLSQYLSKDSSLLDPESMQTATEFMQAMKEDYFDKGNIHQESHASQSGPIFGILKNMKETMEGDLKESQTGERDAMKSFRELKTEKNGEIAEMKDQLLKKQKAMGGDDEARAEAKQTLVDKKQENEANQKIIDELQMEYQKMEQENKLRVKERQEESAAVAKAIEILDGDEAHATMARTLTLVQVGRSSLRFYSSKRGLEKAARYLMAKSAALSAPKLSAIALEMRASRVGDAFGKVLAAIDQMIKDLDKEKADEVEKKDYCETSLNKNQAASTKNERDMSDNNALQGQEESKIQAETTSISDSKKDIEDLQADQKKADEERAEQNKDNARTIADQTASIAILNKALGVLSAFFKSGSFLQTQKPAKFAKYEKSGGNAVIKMIEQIIAETVALKEETEHTENRQQEQYEKFTQDTNEALAAANKAMVNADGAKAAAEEELQDAEDKMDELSMEKTLVDNENSQLHKECDFLLENFTKRQESFSEEADALRNAKDIIKGAAGGSFLQRN